MSNLFLALFGARVTVLYKSGAKMRMRARQFDVKITSTQREVQWRRPWTSWSREPIWMNIDDVEAIWQGKA